MRYEGSKIDKNIHNSEKNRGWIRKETNSPDFNYFTEDTCFEWGMHAQNSSPLPQSGGGVILRGPLNKSDFW